MDDRISEREDAVGKSDLKIEKYRTIVSHIIVWGALACGMMRSHGLGTVLHATRPW